MTQPQRRRPGSASPIKLVPAVEPVQTPAAAPTETPSESPTATNGAPSSSPRQKTSTPRRKPVGSPAPPAPVAADAAPDTKAPVTVTLRRSIKKTAETAVLRTAGLPDGYQSFSALVEGAVQRELQRLADEYNGGEAFTPNGGAFRQGRPFSS